MRILVINGPNLNLLGLREPDIYGTSSYQDLVNLIEEYRDAKEIVIDIKQSNYEGEIVEIIQKAHDNYEGIVINPAAYTHTSIAILDALQAVGLPTIEVHISNLALREDFRKKSYIRAYCLTSIIGKGVKGYLLALDYLIKELEK